MCSGVSPLAPGWLGSALFLPESSDCTRSRSPLMAAAESVLCCRLRSSPLKAGAVEGRTLSGSPLSRRVQEEVHAMWELFRSVELWGVKTDRPKGTTTTATSPPLTRRAASTAQSIRLLLRNGLVCLLRVVRPVGRVIHRGKGVSKMCSRL